MSHFSSTRSLAIILCAGLFYVHFAEAKDLSNVKSGLHLGVYATPAGGGMEVTRLMPGYSAEGRLLPGDILMRATTDGLIIHQLSSTDELEIAKQAIGANRPAAVEILRPGQGLIYAWIKFTAIAAPAPARSIQNKAMFRIESEKPIAREMFGSSVSGDQKSVELLKPGFSEREVPSDSVPFTEPSSESAANLFRRK